MKRVFIGVTLCLLFASLVLGACAPRILPSPAASIDESAAEASKTAESPLIIYAPASTSSIPVLLAAAQLENVQVVLYTNQSQANTLFLRGEVSILITGLSVGMDMYKNDVPLQIINTYVSGLSYLVTFGEPVTAFEDLKGKEVYVPFEGSPIEEVSAYFAQQAGLSWKEDITPVYSPFESSIELLKQGKADAVVLPEPSVSLVESLPNVHVSLSYFDLWNESQADDQGYPQVGAFVNMAWAETHADDISRFNEALAEGIQMAQQDAPSAVAAVKANYKLPEEKLLAALNRTAYNLLTGEKLEEAIRNYYAIIGNPQDDENFQAFYYQPLP